MHRKSEWSRLLVVLLFTALVPVAQADSSNQRPRIEPAADFDGDGVANALDNCLVGPNSDQRDSDHDGIGDACDADVNNDGVVDQNDLRALTQAFGTSERDKDLNGDGTVDRKDLQILLDLLKRGLPPRLDTDGDGVADLEDPCPSDPVGVPSMLPGCTALELLQQANAIFGPLLSKIMKGASDLRAVPEMVGVVADLEGAADSVGEASSLVRRGEVCASSPLFAQADERVAAALDDIDRQLAAARAALRGLPPGTGGGATAQIVDTAGDVSEADLLVAGLQYWQEQVEQARALNRGGAAAFAGICGATTLGTARGVIQSLLDAQRRIVLTDGRTFGLAEPLALTGDVFEGRAVQLGGLVFADGNGYATEVGPYGASGDVPPAAYVQCLRLRFAPVQRFPPISSGPFILHDPLGYKSGGLYKVETGMGLAAQSACSPGKGGRSFPRYSLKVEISYQQKKTAAAIDHAPMAPELTASDDPVLFPGDIDPDVAATLHVTSEMRSCTPAKFSLQCSDPTVIDSQDYPLIVRPRGTLAFATYDQTEFDVNDQLSGDFRFAHVAFFTSVPPVDNGTGQTFVAEGYGPFFDGIIQSQIVNGDPFAIRSVDVYPIFPGLTTAQFFGEFMAGLLAGVDHPAGLAWPRVEGTRNGRAFSYSAALPIITRDVVNFCPAPHAYYRLPFPHGNFNWSQGQGNHPELASGTPGFTHAGGYAYDMIAPLSSEIRAARAGRVVKITESNMAQCDPGDGCDPNNVFIRHQDGSIGEYVHMPQNSVLPEVGDVVQRGELIAVVGVVGPTSGPHLHFATRTQPKPGGTTFLARFEALFPLPPFIDEELPVYCYVPQEGDALRSNNLPVP